MEKPRAFFSREGPGLLCFAKTARAYASLRTRLQPLCDRRRCRVRWAKPSLVFGRETNLYPDGIRVEAYRRDGEIIQSFGVNLLLQDNYFSMTWACAIAPKKLACNWFFLAQLCFPPIVDSSSP